jgi:hypothetical protein
LKFYLIEETFYQPTSEEETMRTRTLKQAFLALTQIIIIAVCLSAPALAQVPNPTPPPRPINEEETSEPTKISFSEALTKLGERASTLLPAVQQQVEGPLRPWLEKLSVGLAFFVMMIAFAKIWRENEGAGTDLIWWFARLGVVFALLGNGPKIVDGMSAMGNEIANGNEVANGVSIATPLATFYETQKNNFNNSYKSFIDGVFTVKTTGETVTPASSGLGIIGVVTSGESNSQDPIRKFDGISRNMPLLFDSLDLSRGVLSFGDFFLTALQSFLMIVMRLAAPVMIALAIDRSLAHKITYPFAWGLVVLTFVWPIVVLIIKAIAYMGGNIAMGLGDGKQFHTFDENTMQIIQNGDPFYTVVFASLIMLIAGLSLWGAPYIAYQLSVGRVYEGVSSTISGWVGHLVGAGIGYYSTAVAASISRQAENTQINAQAQATQDLANAAMKRDIAIAGASNRLGRTSALAAFINQSAGLRGSLEAQARAASTNYLFDQAVLDAQKERFTADAEIQRKYNTALNDNAHNADYEGFKGDKAKIGLDAGGKVVETVAKYSGGLAELGGKGAAIASATGKAIPGAGPAIAGAAELAELSGKGTKINLEAAGSLSKTVLETSGAYAKLHYAEKASDYKYFHNNEAANRYAGDLTKNQEKFTEAVTKANDNRVDGLMNGIQTGYDTSLKGARGAYGAIVGGYNDAYKIIVGANKAFNGKAVEVAGNLQAAGLQAADLRFSAALAKFLGDEFRRTAERTIPLRF